MRTNEFSNANFEAPLFLRFSVPVLTNSAFIRSRPNDS